MIQIWFQFSVCLVIIALAGYRLCRYADVIAEKTGLSGSWIGIVLLDFMLRGESLYSRVAQGHILAAALGVLMLGFAGFSILLGGLTGCAWVRSTWPLPTWLAATCSTS